MFCIICDIMPDIILGMALVVNASTTPLTAVPRRAASSQLFVWDSVLLILAGLLLPGSHFRQPAD
jgi:hypothetical protein